MTGGCCVCLGYSLDRSMMVTGSVVMVTGSVVMVTGSVVMVMRSVMMVTGSVVKVTRSVVMVARSVVMVAGYGAVAKEVSQTANILVIVMPDRLSACSADAGGSVSLGMAFIIRA